MIYIVHEETYSSCQYKQEATTGPNRGTSLYLGSHLS